jgi:hypothetical protein
MSDLVAEIAALTSDQRQQIYLKLWNELTIAGRAIWSDPSYSDPQKLEGLKWLNEIQHRVWNGYMQVPGYTPELLLSLINDHVRQADHIRGHVGTCFRRAINSAVGT